MTGSRRTSLWLANLIIVVAAAAVAGWAGYRQEHQRVARKLMQNLELNHELTISSVTGDLAALRDEIQLLALNERVKEFLGASPAAKTDFDAWAKACVNHFGYYDLFLISATGDVVYSVAEEKDLNTNLESGPYADSGLGALYRKVLKTHGFSLNDYSVYAPSNNELAGFIGSPVMVKGRFEGVLAIQLPTAFVKLNIGVHIEHIQDYILTAEYYFKREGSFGALKSLKLPARQRQALLSGDSLVVATPFSLPGLNWRIVSIAPPVVFTNNISRITIGYYVVIAVLVAQMFMVLFVYYFRKKEEERHYSGSDIVLVQNTWHQFNQRQHSFGSDFCYRLKNKAHIPMADTEMEVLQLGKLIEQEISAIISILHDEEALAGKLQALARQLMNYAISPANLKKVPALFLESFEDEQGRKIPARARHAWGVILTSLSRRIRQLMQEEMKK